MMTPAVFCVSNGEKVGSSSFGGFTSQAPTKQGELCSLPSPQKSSEQRKVFDPRVDETRVELHLHKVYKAAETGTLPKTNT